MDNKQEVLHVQGAVGAYDLRYSFVRCWEDAGPGFSKEMPFRPRPRDASALSRGRVQGENILGGRTGEMQRRPGRGAENEARAHPHSALPPALLPLAQSLLHEQLRLIRHPLNASL